MPKGQMWKFLARKAVFYILTFFVALSLVWLLPRLMPGNPVGTLISSIMGGGGAGGGASGGGGGGGSSQLYQRLYTEWVLRFGLNRPIYEQYGIFLTNTLTFSFGPSIMYYPTSALEIVSGALPWSLALLLPAIIIGWIVGSYLGAAAAFKKGVYDKLLYPIFLIGANTPYYWFALILVTLLTGTFRVFPPGGAYSVTVTPGLNYAFITDALFHYALPFLSLLIPYIGRMALGMRSMVLYEIGSDYMEYSASLGFPRGKLLRYAFRNAVLPSITSLPLYLGGAFAGQVVSEVVFGYPGIGLVLYTAVLNQDYNIIQCAFTLIVLVILIGNFVADILYAYVDPRIRLTYKEEK